jgi:hypothetical protein
MTRLRIIVASLLVLAAAAAGAAFTTDARNYMLDQRLGTGASSGTYASLHSADCTTTYTTAQANEIAGGSPAYARKQLNLNAASSGSKTLAANAVFDIQAGDSFSHVASGGAAADYIGCTALTSAESAYGSQGTYTLTAETFTIN